MCPAVRSLSGFSTAPITFRMSRSVMMPSPDPSGSCTTAEPVRRADMNAAAWRSVCSGPTVSTALLIASRTCMAHHPSQRTVRTSSPEWGCTLKTSGRPHYLLRRGVCRTACQTPASGIEQGKHTEWRWLSEPELDLLDEQRGPGDVLVREIVTAGFATARLFGFAPKAGNG